MNTAENIQQFIFNVMVETRWLFGLSNDEVDQVFRLQHGMTSDTAFARAKSFDQILSKTFHHRLRPTESSASKIVWQGRPLIDWLNDDTVDADEIIAAMRLAQTAS